MKNIRVYALAALAAFVSVAAIAASPIQLGGSIFPLTFISQQALNSTDAFNQLETLIAAQVMPVSAVQAPFSTNYNGNPVLSGTYQDLPVSSGNTQSFANVDNVSNNGYQFITGVSGITLYPTGMPVVTASGTPGAGTSLLIYCSPSARKIATYAVSTLASGVAVVPISAGNSQGNIIGNAFSSGCASGDGINASAVGSAMTTTTDFLINLPYMAQATR